MDPGLFFAQSHPDISTCGGRGKEGWKEEEPILEDEWWGAVGPRAPSALLAPEVVVVPLPAQLVLQVLVEVHVLLSEL